MPCNFYIYFQIGFKLEQYNRQNASDILKYLI